MAQAIVPTILTSIDEEEEALSDVETIVDPIRLKRLRTNGKMAHTKAGKKLAQSVRIGEDRDTVRALRANYVREFDSLETCHDRYVQCNAPNCSANDLEGEIQWIQAVIYDHQSTLADCDDYVAWTKPKSSSSVHSRASSRHSSVSSRQARIHEAEQREKEAELMLQQTLEETTRREEEDAKIRELDEYKQRVESERKQRELRNEMDRQRLSGAIMRRQLAELIADEQPGPTRASSVTSNMSRVSGSSSRSATPAVSLPNIATTSTATQASTVNTPLVGSTSRIPTPTRLFTQSTATTPPTPTVGFLGKMRNLASKVFTPGSSLPRSSSMPHIPTFPVQPPTTLPPGNVNTGFSRGNTNQPSSLGSAFPNSTNVGPANLGPSHGPGLSARIPTVTTLPSGSGSSHGPANTTTTYSLPLFTPSMNNEQPASTPFPGYPGTPAHPPTVQHPPTVYTPDAWIRTINTPPAGTNRPGIKPPRMKAPTFDGDPRNWPMFIQMFKVFVHDAVSSDAERIAHLYDALTPTIRKDIGGALLNPGLYQHALNELQRRYGNPQIVSQACTSSLLKLRPFRDNDFSALRAFSADLHSVVATLKLGGYGMELYSHTTLSQLISKLPPALKSRWGEKSWAMQPTLASIEDLDQWLDGVSMAEQSIRASSIETPHRQHIKPSEEKRRTPHKPNVFTTTSVTPPKPNNDEAASRCPGCNSKHPHRLKDCRKFRDIPVEKRAQIVKEANLCLRCLGSDHLSRACTRTERCSKPDCDGIHHPLLHGAPRLYPQRMGPGSTTTKFSGSVATKSAGSRTLLPIVPVILKANGNEYPLYALLDPGSEISVIRGKTAALINLRGKVERVATRTVNGETKSVDRKIVNFSVTSIDGRFSFDISDAHVMDTFELDKRPINLASLREQWPHLAHVPVHSTTKEDVAILIGHDHPSAIEIFETRKDPFDQRAPRAYLSAFGWYIGGPCGKPSDDTRDCFHSHLAERECDVLLQQFVEADTFGTKPNVTKPIGREERRAWDILNNTTRHNGERYEVNLLWKMDNPDLPNNLFLAQRRFFNLERKLIKDKDLGKVYGSVISTYVNLHHARKLSREEINAGPLGRTWYCPHHPVFNPNKPGKCRVVFDLSAKHNGICLNDALLKGPDLMTNLIGVLLRFRQHAIPLVADIEKMFHQVRIRSPDGPAFRFIWREPGSANPPDVYQMEVHLFGAVSSPAICAYALQQAVKDSEDPKLLLRQISRHFYVDNWLTSFPSTSEAISTAHQLTRVLRAGGFPLTQWATSNDVVRKAIPGQRKEGASINMDLDEDPIERTLGLVWDFRRDVFVLGAKAEPGGRTKRDLLKSIFSIFDPLGFLAPIVFQAKVLMQDIWRRKFDWDDELSQDLIDRWIRWTETLPSLSKLVLERCISPPRNDLTATELHIFGDASELGFGAVAYVRFLFNDRPASVKFIISKARVAPLKFLTIPRLELNAAVLAARLGTQVCVEHDLAFGQIFYWTDSTTVLSWINSRNCRFNNYVGNRIGEIFETTTPDQWNYVPSASNPADDASRGLDASEFTIDHRWFSGPSFLRGLDNWPELQSLPVIDETDPEIRETAWIGVVQREIDGIDLLIDRKSRPQIIFNAVAYLFRFIWNARQRDPNQRRANGLSADEVQMGKSFILQRTQANAYQQEMNCLRAGRPIEKDSKLIKLAPFLDHRGFMCVGGRIEKAPLPIDSRHPIILPRSERMTELILFKLHRDRGHLSASELHHEARREFWIPKGLITAQRVRHLCYLCRRRSAKGTTPIMAALPTSRLKVGYPTFTHTGVDYFGPINVTIFRRTIKRWGCLFTCLTSRCVHLEMAYSMDTSSFISALDRFQNRRGVPASYHSDNGTNFVGAQRELAECLQNLNQDAILRHLNRQPSKWVFNPPAAPHFGGVWERMVRAAKIALRAVLGNQRLTDEILLTALTLIENILNSRKLTPISDDPNDSECLTPNHLLLGRATPNLPPDVFTEDDLTAKQRWRIAQAVADQFWQRWMKEVLPSLTEREKWYQEHPNLQVGDIVVIIDPATPRGTWPTGKIIQTFPGDDGVVRSVNIQTNGTERHRPAHSLFLLESVLVREGALGTAKRRAGDVAELELAKTVSFKSDLATPQPEEEIR
ncbi:uncharacterized protein LOC130695542 [Daphnia carinata]|uniref:uncharacterized protein LOC130695542 n=1 Tax=Daphnia carinata TaxID=120202 RepID=UPI002579794E|nr:uncharacterized protein LOC130695542 [Daphnia carinata]